MDNSIMCDTLQHYAQDNGYSYRPKACLQALFGGNITGRRLRGVKINPIYQGNYEPGGHIGPVVVTESESALPIGEIQIEVYDSLPRKVQKQFRQCSSSPVLPSRELASPCFRSDDGEGQPLDVCEKEGEVGRVKGKGGGEDVKLSLTVSSAMDVGNVPWTFLQERSPVRRKPVWGAFWGVGNTAPVDDLHERGEDLAGGTDKLGYFQTRTKSSSSLFAVPYTDDIDVIDDEGSEEGAGSVNANDGEKGETVSVPQTQTETGQDSSDVVTKTSPAEYQSYFVTSDVSENLGAFPPLQSSSNKQAQSEVSVASNEYVYSDFVHFAQHNCHHYSGLESTETGTLFRKGEPEELQMYPYPTRGGNGLRLNRAFTPESGQLTCACPCHFGTTSPDSMIGLAGSHQSCRTSDETSHLAQFQQGTCSDLRRNTNSFSKGKCKKSSLCKKADSCPHLKCAPEVKPRPFTHVQSEVCMPDFEQSNTYSVSFHVRKHSWSRQSSEQAENEAENITSSEDNQNTGSTECSPVNVNAKTADTVTNVSCQLHSSKCSLRDSNSNTIDFSETNSHTAVADENSGVCEFCGCSLDADDVRQQYLDGTDFGVTSSRGVKIDDTTNSGSVQAATGNMTSLFSSDSILLRADELNAPAYLQRYLLEAQKNYLQHQNSAHVQHGSDLTGNTSSALPITDLTIPPELLDFVTQDAKAAGLVPDDAGVNGDSVSFVEELGPQKKKSSSCWKKSFKSTGGGSSNSRTTSGPSSRQSSRNSRGAKHCSIEDLDAGEVELVLGEGVGSLWGGSSSNHSNSIVDRNENLKKAGLSIVHIEGTSTDPAFEMIVPYDEAYEEESNYSSRRRRQRMEEMSATNAWKVETPLKERMCKAAVFIFVIGAIVGIFIGLAVHFGKDSVDSPDAGSVSGGLMPHGSIHGFR